jgi:steroid delta-isomerase-like uncharacterized protein
MTAEENKALVRRFVEEVFERGRQEAVDELVADDFVPHTWSTGEGRDGLKQAMERISRALADVTFEIDDMIAEGDRVCVRLTASAKQVAEFMGLPPSGRSYSIGEIHLFRVRDGLIVEHWHQFDQLGLMRQLRAMPGG